MKERRKIAAVWSERILRRLRYKKALKYLKEGRILDFGCDDQSLKEYLPKSCEYIGCEKDYSIIKGKFDTIFMIAVLEHLNQKNAYKVLDLLFNSLNYGGRLIITTPSVYCKTLLEFLAFKLHLEDKEAVREHLYYWSKNEFIGLAKNYGLFLEYKTFQFGLNQLVMLEKSIIIDD